MTYPTTIPIRLPFILALSSVTPCLALSGIPEPGAIFYGRVENTQTASAVAITSLSWSITEAGTGKLVNLSVGNGIELVSFNSETWYVARIGFETNAVSGFDFDAPAPNTFTLSNSPVNYSRSAVIVNGQVAALKSPATDSFALPETAIPAGPRSRLERVDLTISVNTSALYQAWIDDFYPLNDPRSGPNQDPDKDGLTNLMERALGLDPSSPSAVPISTSTVEVDGENYYTYTYRYPTGRPDTPLVAEISEDLSSWNSGTNFLIETENFLEGETRRVTVRDKSPIKAPRKAFLRVRVAN